MRIGIDRCTGVDDTVCVGAEHGAPRDTGTETRESKMATTVNPNIEPARQERDVAAIALRMAAESALDVFEGNTEAQKHVLDWLRRAIAEHKALSTAYHELRDRAV